MSNRLKGKKHTSERVANNSEAQKARHARNPCSQETKDKMSKIRSANKIGNIHITATNTLTSEVLLFDSIRECLKHYGISCRNLEHLLNYKKLPHMKFTTTAPVSPVEAFEAEDELAPEFEE